MNAQTLPLFTLMMVLSSNLYCKDSHYRGEFLGMCACMSVHLYAYISMQFPLDRFPWNLILRTFVQSVKILQIWFKIRQKYWAFYMKI